MKRRLSDHDDEVLHRLTGFTDRARSPLGVVHVQGGWAWATDAYRLAALPVDLHVDDLHTVDADQALTGGTVDLTRATPVGCRDWATVLRLGAQPTGWYLPRLDWARELMPRPRQPRPAKTTAGEPHPAAVTLWPSHLTAIPALGRTGGCWRLPGGPVEKIPVDGHPGWTAVHRDMLATCLDLWDEPGGIAVGPSPRGPVTVTPWRDGHPTHEPGWAVVMPIACAFTDQIKGVT